MCCVLPAIRELGKPANVPCKHLTETGCGIYESRPQVCRSFECHWLNGKGASRPDVVGAYTSRMPTTDGWGNGMGILVHIDPNRGLGRHAELQEQITDTLDAGGEVLMFIGESRKMVTRDKRTLMIAAICGLKDQEGRPVTAERA